MATTKPLMFLWGQTPTFDSVVRGRMPRFDIRYNLMGNSWSFEQWKKIMARFRDELGQQPEVLDVFKEVSLREYGTDSAIPYGQFVDLYYWIKNR